MAHLEDAIKRLLRDDLLSPWMVQSDLVAILLDQGVATLAEDIEAKLDRLVARGVLVRSVSLVGHDLVALAPSARPTSV